EQRDDPHHGSDRFRWKSNVRAAVLANVTLEASHLFPAAYFPPAYFPPAFFVPADPSTGTPALSVAYSDRDAFGAGGDASVATGAFANVIVGDRSVSTTSYGADRFPLALVAPERWIESSDSAPGANVHRLTFTLTLAVRDLDPWERILELDRL